MSYIVPTVTAYDTHDYRMQMDRITPFAKRIHIDLMDGVFAPTKSPDIDKIWLPKDIICDMHVMFLHPHRIVKKVAVLKPSILIVQAEADMESVMQARTQLLGSTIRFGVSMLPETDPLDPRYIELTKTSRYVLIFSGHLGYHGGKADLSLLDKVKKIRSVNPRAEIGWDGGISTDNVAILSEAGIDVLNVGGAIQKSMDPRKSYDGLVALA